MGFNSGFKGLILDFFLEKKPGDWFMVRRGQKKDNKQRYVETPCFLVRSQNCDKRLLASSCLSVLLSACNNSVPTGWIFKKVDVLVFFENMSRKLKFY